jgi:hypothetical protein
MSTTIRTAALAAVLLGLPACILVDAKGRREDGDRGAGADISVSAGKKGSKALAAGQDTSAQPAHSAAAPVQAEEAAKKEQEKEKEAAKKAEKRKRELAYARIDLAIAELSTEAERREAQRKLEEAERDLEEAKRALAHFLEFERPHKVAQAKLALDRSRFQREEDVDELQQVQEMYSGEDFAKSTKELVLKRHKRIVEFATRDLELKERDLADLEQEDLPKDQRELEKKVRAAEKALAEAATAVNKTQLSGELALLKARDKVAELERPADDEPKPAGESSPASDREGAP